MSRSGVMEEAAGRADAPHEAEAASRAADRHAREAAVSCSRLPSRWLSARAS